MATNGRRTWEHAFSVIDPQINAEGVHVWPFDSSFPVDVRFFVFDKRRDIRMNRHDYFEILYVDSGDLVCQVQDVLFPMRAGDLVVVGATQYHRIHPPLGKAGGARARAKAAVLYFLPELIRGADAAGDEAQYLAPFLLQDGAFPHVVAARTGIPAEIFDLMGRVGAELPATSARARLAVRTYVKMALVLLVNHYAERRGTTEVFERRQRAIERLRPLFDALETRYGEPMSVRAAAQLVGMSESHFMRFFKGVTGQSFLTYLTRLRIAKAQHLLATTDKSIAEISYEVGFCDQSYFSMVFRELVHMTPLRYKQSTKSHEEPRR